jgi:hypothetical protein
MGLGSANTCGSEIPSRETIRQERSGLVQKIRVSLQDAVRSKELHAFAKSAEVLVEIHDTTHVNLLLQNLDWTTNDYSPKYVSVDVPTLAYYPAADALWKLGPKISPALVRYITKQPPNSVGFEVGCSLLVESHTQMYLSNSKAKSRAISELRMELAGLRKSEPKAERLMQAINLIESYVGRSYGRWHELPRFRAKRAIEGPPVGKTMNVSLGLSLPVGMNASDFRINLLDDEQTQHEWTTRSKLPKGVTIDSNAWLRGTPESSGTFEFVVQARSLKQSGIVNQKRFVLDIPES